MAGPVGLIDPQSGEFQYATQPQAGPGNIGPLGGLLQIMNVLKGQKLADQNAANRQLTNMGEVQKLGVGGMDFSTPEGQQALQGLGISPETAQTQIQNAPAMKVRQSLATYQQAHPGEQIPSQVIEEAYIGAGMPPPPGLYGYMGRQDTQNRLSSQGIQKELGTAYQKHLASALTDREARNNAAQEISTLHPELADKLQAWVALGTDQPTPYAKARLEKTGAQTEEAKAGAEERLSRASYYDQIAGPTAAARAAQAGFAAEHTQAVKTLDEINRIRADNGGVLPAVQGEKMDEEIGRDERALAAALSKPGNDPKELQAALEAVQKSAAKLRAAKPVAAAKPYGANPGEFKSVDEVKGAYQSGAITREEAQQILNTYFGVPLPGK